MRTQQPYSRLLITVLFLSLLFQHCGQPNEGLSNMEASNASERSIKTPDPVLSTSYGPFPSASGAMVTLQQAEGRWHARVVEEAGTVVDEQQLDVGCATGIAKTVSQLQHQPSDYIKSRIHVLSPAQSPTGKRAIYLGRLGLRGGMDRDRDAEDNPEEDNSEEDHSERMRNTTIAGDLETLRRLVEEGLDVHEVSSQLYGGNALYWAAGYGHLAIVKYLIEEKGADVYAMGRLADYPTALHHAAVHRNLAVVKYLVEEKGMHVDAVSRVRFLNRGTALHDAVVGGHLDVIEYLVEKGADVNARGDNGTTALYWAAGNHTTESLGIIKYLVDNGADVNVKNNDDYGISALHQAARAGHLAIVQYFVEKGADVNAQDDNGATALYWAAGNHTTESLAIVQYLVEEKGANVNAKASDGLTALHKAAQKGHLAIVQYFVEKGANVNAKASDGLTALHKAAQEGHLAIVQYLVEEKGANVNAKASDGATALHGAAKKGHLAIVQYFVEEKGADVNVQDNQGLTSLHWAAREGHLAIILYLIEEAGLYNHLRTILNPQKRCFSHWENIGPYARFASLADTLFSEEGCLQLRQAAPQEITDESRGLKLVYEGAGDSPREECPHDLGTAFTHRFKNRIRREGVPEAMWLNPEGYFTGIQLPDSLKTELQTFVDYIKEGREGFIAQASSLVASFASTKEESKEVSPAPLSFIVCPRAGLHAYNPEDPRQKQTVEFYTQRSPELAGLILDGEDVRSAIDSGELERALCKYLCTHLSKIGSSDETFKAVVKDGARKGQVMEQIADMLKGANNVVFPTGFKAKLEPILEKLQTPDVPQAIEELQAMVQQMAPHLSTPGWRDAYQHLGHALSCLNASATLQTGSRPSPQDIAQQGQEKKRKIGD